DQGPPLPFAPLGLRYVVAEPREATERERVRAEDSAGEIVLHVSRHAGDDRDDGDEEHDADRHAEQREEALELLYANRLERESDRFVEEFHLFVTKCRDGIEAGRANRGQHAEDDAGERGGTERGEHRDGLNGGL